MRGVDTGYVSMLPRYFGKRGQGGPWQSEEVYAYVGQSALNGLAINRVTDG